MTNMGRPKVPDIDRVLAYLYEAGTEVPTGEIARGLNMNVTTAHQSLRRLKEEGWLSGRKARPDTSSGRRGRPTTMWRTII